MQEDYKYRAFISYSHKDISFARWLHKKIENYKIPKSLREKYQDLPKDLKRSIFRDEEELPTAGSLPFNLEKNLQLSQKLIVICSPNAAGVDKKENQKNWIDEEIKYFKSYHKDGNKKILPIMISGIPHASELAVYDSKDECFPKALRYRVDSNGNITDENEEVLAADARVKWYEFNKKRKALIKVIAGVLGVDFADLWERDKREQRKRVIAQGVFIALFSGSVFFGYQNYIQKTHVQKENIVLKKHSQEYVETLAQIKELESKLENARTNEEKSKLWQELEKKKERLKILEEIDKSIAKLQTEVAKKAAEIFRKNGAKKALAFLDAAKIEEQEKKNRKIYSEIYRFKALLYTLENNYKMAEKYFKKAYNTFDNYENSLIYADFLYGQKENNTSLVIYKKLLKKAKLDNLSKMKLSIKIGAIYYRLKNLDMAQSYLHQALDLYNNLSIQNKKLSSQANILNNLSLVYWKKRKYKEAEYYLKETLIIRKKLTNIDNFKKLNYLADSYHNFGLFYQEQGKIKLAEQYFNKALELRKKLAKEIGDKDEFYFYQLAKTLNDLAILYETTNEKKDEEKLLEALKNITKAVSKNPDAYNDLYAMILENISKFYFFHNNELKKAEEYIKQSIKVYEVLVNKNKNLYINNLIESIEFLSSSILNSQAKFEESINYYRKGIKYYKLLIKSKLLDKNQKDKYIIYLGDTYYNIGFMLEKQSKLKEAFIEYENALNIYKQLFQEKLSNENFKLLMDRLNDLYKFYGEQNRLKNLIEIDKYLLDIVTINFKEKNSANKLSVINDLVILLALDNQINKANKYYHKGREIYKSIAFKTKEANIEYAKLLIIGFNYLNKPKQNIRKAKKILQNFRGIPDAEYLLEEIRAIEE